MIHHPSLRHWFLTHQPIPFLPLTSSSRVIIHTQPHWKLWSKKQQHRWHPGSAKFRGGAKAILGNNLRMVGQVLLHNQLRVRVCNGFVRVPWAQVWWPWLQSDAQRWIVTGFYPLQFDHLAPKRPAHNFLQPHNKTKVIDSHQPTTITELIRQTTRGLVLRQRRRTCNERIHAQTWTWISPIRQDFG